MTKFRVGDKVVCRNYEYFGIEKDCFGTVSKVAGDEIYCNDWSYGDKYGWLCANELELVNENHWQKIIDALESAIDHALENCEYDYAIELGKKLDEAKKNV